MASQGTTPHRGADTLTPLAHARPAPGALPAAAAPPASARVAVALGTSLLLYLCFFPVCWGWLAWVALVPLLTLVRSPARPARVYLAAWAAALAFYWPVLQWMRVADPRMYVTWGMLATYSSLYVPLALSLVRLLDRRLGLPLTVTFPVVWTAVEYFRTNFIGGYASTLSGSHVHDHPGGFGWYCVGYSQHDFPALLQLADLAGVYGVGFVVCAVNALLFEVLFARPWFARGVVGVASPPRPDRLRLLAQGVGVVGLLLAALAYGGWRLREDTQKDGPRLALFQGDLDQRIRNQANTQAEGSDDARQAVGDHFGALAVVAARYRTDLHVWSETSYPQTWVEYAPGRPDPRSRELAAAFGKATRTSTLLGLQAQVPGDDGRRRTYNSAVLLGPRGEYGGRYDKIHRVPFGEYVPWRETLPAMNQLAPYEEDYSVTAGGAFTRFALPTAGGRGYTFGVVICYEDTISQVTRPYGGGDGVRPVDFLLNISNDGWFNGTSEHDEHLAVCRFRAVECRRSVARAVNMGISAVVDSNGRVLAPRLLGWADGLAVWEVPAGADAELPVGRWKEFKKVAGVLLADVPVDTRASWYALYGDWFAAGCGLLTLAGAALAAFRRPPAPGAA